MDLYFQGMAWLNKALNSEDYLQARVFFERALALDPGNIDALIGYGSRRSGCRNKLCTRRPGRAPRGGPGGKGTYWTSDDHADTARQWREAAQRHDGSWWTDWVAWLAARSGNKGKPPSLGSAAHPPLQDAPGSYVLDRNIPT